MSWMSFELTITSSVWNLRRRLGSDLMSSAVSACLCVSAVVCRALLGARLQGAGETH